MGRQAESHPEQAAFVRDHQHPSHASSVKSAVGQQPPGAQRLPSPVSPLTLNPVAVADTISLAPFREVAFEQLPSFGRPPRAAPTVVHDSDCDSDKREGCALLPPPRLAYERGHTQPELHGQRREHAFPPKGYPASTHMHIHANVVNVYNVSPLDMPSEMGAGMRGPKINQGGQDRVNSAGPVPHPIVSKSPPGTWQPYISPPHLDQEAALYAPSPRIHAMPVSGHMGEHTMPLTAPPEFLDSEHLQALHQSNENPHDCSEPVLEDAAASAAFSTSLSRPGSPEEDPHSIDDAVLLDSHPRTCPEGKEDCACQVDSMELFKNAATYLYKHTRTLKQELYQAQVHIRERIALLQRSNALNGGPDLPSSVFEFLQTETDQLHQEWAIAEAKCSQYICDCILAEVEGMEIMEPSEGSAKGIPPDVVSPEEAGASIPTDHETDSHQAQCSERFEDLRKDLVALTHRSDRLKRQWANLLDLCNKLEEVAEICRSTETGDLNAPNAPGNATADASELLRPPSTGAEGINQTQINGDWYWDPLFTHYSL